METKTVYLIIDGVEFGGHITKYDNRNIFFVYDNGFKIAWQKINLKIYKDIIK